MRGLSLCMLLLGSTNASILDYIPLVGRAASALECERYTVKAGDNCLTISHNNNITFAQLISWNSDITQACTNFANLEGTAICVSNPEGDYALPTNSNGATTTASTPAPVPTNVPDDTNRRCGEYYQVELGDDCSTLLAASGITREDFLFLNPQVWQNCTNLWLDYYYCIMPVGDITTYPGYGGATTRPPINQTPTTQLPNIGDILANYTSHDPVIPFANGTRLDCKQYVWLDNITDNVFASCWSLAMAYEVPAEDFILWNPSLAEVDAGEDQSAIPGSVARRAAETATALAETSARNYAYHCTLDASSSYCVMLSSPTDVPPKEVVPPSPRAAGEIEGCTRWTAPREGNTCEKILIIYQLSFDDWYKMNPSVGDDCSKMSLGTYYCLSTNPYGIPCGIASNSSSSTSDIPTRTTSVPTTTSGTEIVTPSPVQTGITSDCDEFYKVVKDDLCGDIAEEHGISLDNFYKWNPAVKNDCTGLLYDYYVCVGVE